MLVEMDRILLIIFRTFKVDLSVSRTKRTRFRCCLGTKSDCNACVKHHNFDAIMFNIFFIATNDSSLSFSFTSKNRVSSAITSKSNNNQKKKWTLISRTNSIFYLNIQINQMMWQRDTHTSLKFDTFFGLVLIWCDYRWVKSNVLGLCKILPHLLSVHTFLHISSP